MFFDTNNFYSNVALATLFMPSAHTYELAYMYNAKRGKLTGVGN